MTITWNPSDKSSLQTLSNGNLTTTHDASATRGLARANGLLRSTSKVYFEWTPATAGGGIGLATSAAALNTYLGADNNGIGYFGLGTVWINNVQVSTIQTWTTGDNIGVAVDVANAKVWFRTNGGNWNNSGAANPATNTGGISFPALSAADYQPPTPCVDGISSSAGTANFGGSAYAYTPPSGFANIVVEPGPKWNSADKHANIDLSGCALTASGNTAGDGGVRATASLPSGAKLYWSAYVRTVDTNRPNIGFGNASATLSSYLGVDNNGLSYAPSGAVLRNNTTIATYASFTSGDIIDVALDLANSKVWFRKNGGNWNNDVIGNQNPATNTGGLSISGLAAGPYYPMVSCYNTAAAVANFGASIFTAAPPSGFSPLEAYGSAVKTLGAVTLSAQGRGLSGDLAKTLPPVILTAAAKVEISGALGQALGAVGASGGASGGMLNAALGPITNRGFVFKWDAVPPTPQTWSAP